MKKTLRQILRDAFIQIERENRLSPWTEQDRDRMKAKVRAELERRATLRRRMGNGASDN